MDRRAWSWVSALLAFIVCAELLATTYAHLGTELDYLLPAGLFTGVAYFTARRYEPLAILAAFAAGFVPLLLDGRPLALSVGEPLVLALEGAAVVRLLLHETWLPGDAGANPVGRFLLSCVAGSGLGALGFTLVSLTAGEGTWWVVLPGALVTQLTSQLLLVPFFLPELTAGHHQTSLLERSGRWLTLVAMSVIVFSPLQINEGAILLLPVLAWSALRGTVREVLWQLIWLDVLTVVATLSDLGPFARTVDHQRSHLELAWLAPQVFLLSCAAVCVPFCMMVGREHLSTSKAAAERSRNERLLASVGGICIIGTDHRGLIDSFNPGAEQILGYRFEDVVGTSPARFHTEAEVRRQADRLGCEPTYDAVLEALRAQGWGEGVDVEFIRKDGVPRILSLILGPVRDDDGHLVGHVATAEDVTERVRTQQALEEALRIEGDAAERMRDIDRAKDSFVSSVSHELRTPITNIVGYLELLEDGMYGDLNAEQHGAVDRIDQNSRRLLALIDDLLALSSIEDLDVELGMEPLDLREIVRHAEEIFRPGLFGRSLRLDVALPRHPVVIVGDAAHLERLVVNLVRNAIKFTPDGGSISVSLRGDGAWWCLEVEDTGMGIAPEEQPMLFNRFFRSTNAEHAAIQGSGLGLSIARTIAERHGAMISVSSTLGVGTVFRVESLAQRQNA